VGIINRGPAQPDKTKINAKKQIRVSLDFIKPPYLRSKVLH
jgi:hypothetical protein